MEDCGKSVVGADLVAVFEGQSAEPTPLHNVPSFPWSSVTEGEHVSFLAL